MPGIRAVQGGRVLWNAPAQVLHTNCYEPCRELRQVAGSARANCSLPVLRVTKRAPKPKGASSKRLGINRLSNMAISASRLRNAAG